MITPQKTGSKTPPHLSDREEKNISASGSERIPKEDKLSAENQSSSDFRLNKEPQRSTSTQNNIDNKTKNSPIGRFFSQIDSRQIDKSTGRTFRQMFETQEIKRRPFVIAKCLCDRHLTGSPQKSNFIHPEFIDGNIAFEAMENKRLPSITDNDLFGEFTPTPQQKALTNEYIARDFEFWAINTRDKNFDRVANRSDIVANEIGPGLALDALLSSDIKPLAAEDDSDHMLAYVVAGMYHSGHIVQKDELFATQTVSLLQMSDLPYCQANSLQYALEINIRVFRSLLELGVNPKQHNEEGMNIMDIARSKKQSHEYHEAIAILRDLGHLES